METRDVSRRGWRGALVPVWAHWVEGLLVSNRSSEVGEQPAYVSLARRTVRLRLSWWPVGSGEVGDGLSLSATWTVTWRLAPWFAALRFCIASMVMGIGNGGLRTHVVCVWILVPWLLYSISFSKFNLSNLSFPSLCVGQWLHLLHKVVLNLSLNLRIYVKVSALCSAKIRPQDMVSAVITVGHHNARHHHWIRLFINSSNAGFWWFKNKQISQAILGHCFIQWISVDTHFHLLIFTFLPIWRELGTWVLSNSCWKKYIIFCILRIWGCPIHYQYPYSSKTEKK